MNNKKVYWHLPGIVFYGAINHVLIAAMQQYPTMFREGYEIGSVYGAFPNAIWNGGRYLGDGVFRENDVKRVIESYNTFGIPVRFTWTNVLLEDKHLDNEFCNMVMRAGNNGLNQVLVSTDVLENYIRKTYPEYKVLSSTTKRILSVDKLLEEVQKDYYLVVLDYDLNHNDQVIEKLLPYADRIEILANETCQPNCPQRVNHYREISKVMLNPATSGKLKYVCTDRNKDARTFKGCMKRPAFMSTADVDAYVEKGFVNYKIVGRGLTMDFYLDSLIYYLVKPEHRDFIRKFMTDTLSRLKRR